MEPQTEIKLTLPAIMFIGMVVCLGVVIAGVALAKILSRSDDDDDDPYDPTEPYGV